MKCAICNEKIESLYLGKIKGTYIKNKPVCNKCQSKYKEDKLKEMIK